MNGNTKPSKNDLANIIVAKSEIFSELLLELHKTKKTKALLMVLAVICSLAKDADQARMFARRSPAMAVDLDLSLAPQSAERCWGRGVAFSIAMERAKAIVQAQW